MARTSTRPDKAVVVAALRETKTVEEAAARLGGGVHRTTLQRWMRELGISREWTAAEFEEEGARSAT